jgi:hypothetical protein
VDGLTRAYPLLPLRPSMVRRGSTVRVRQRALQERRKPALFVSSRLAESPIAVGMEPFKEPRPDRLADRGCREWPRCASINLAWALELAAAPDQTSTAFFMKQLGTAVGRECGSRDQKGGDFGTLPSTLRRREMPLAIQQRFALGGLVLQR